MEQRGREQHRWANNRSNGAYGKSDIEGKTAREAASELGKERVSNGREHTSQSVGQQTSFKANINRSLPIDHKPLTIHETSGAVVAGVPPAKGKTAAASGASPQFRKTERPAGAGPHPYLGNPFPAFPLS